MPRCRAKWDVPSTARTKELAAYRRSSVMSSNSMEVLHVPRRTVMIRPNGHLKRLHSDRETNVKSYQDKQYSLLKEFCNKGLLHLPKLKTF
jgi:hypothetical protein